MLYACYVGCSIKVLSDPKTNISEFLHILTCSYGEVRPVTDQIEYTFCVLGWCLKCPSQFKDLRNNRFSSLVLLDLTFKRVLQQCVGMLSVLQYCMGYVSLICLQCYISVRKNYKMVIIQGI